MKAQICPICQGTGKYTVVKYRYPYDVYPFTTSPIEYHSEKTCHGCNGKGWIIVPDIPPFDFDKIT